MKLKEFWSRNNLDEMQQQTLLNIEARSFWLLWGMLLAALIIQSLCGFTMREMAAEWIVFMVGCVYTVGTASVRVFGTDTSPRIRKQTFCFRWLAAL